MIVSHTLSHYIIVYHTISLYHFVPHYITLHHSVPPYITLHHSVPHCITLHHSVPHYITLHHSVPHYITLHHSVPHYIIVYHADHNISLCTTLTTLSTNAPQCGAADIEIRVPSGENTELKGSPFKAWSRSVYSHHATLTARDFFLAYFYPSVPFTYIFSKTSPEYFCFCF